MKISAPIKMISLAAFYVFGLCISGYGGTVALENEMLGYAMLAAGILCGFVAVMTMAIVAWNDV